MSLTSRPSTERGRRLGLFGCLGLFACLWLGLLWVTALNGGALWFNDVGPYVKGGHLGVTTVVDRLAAPPAPDPSLSDGAGSSTGGGGLAPRGAVRGARAVGYSVAAYLGALPLPRFWMVAIVQAGVLAWLATGLAFAARLSGAQRAGLAGVLVLGTSAPFTAGTVMPDVWAGLLVLSFVLLDAYRERLSLPAVLVAGGVAAFAVASHASHVALAGALVLASVLASLVTRSRGGALRVAVPLGVVAAGVAATVASGMVGFGEASVAPKRYPIVLARAVEDGPGLWHLQEHCDEHGYAVCELFGEDIPDNVGDFLWNEGGVRDLATPEQMNRIRAEEALIVRRATAEYPFAQARRAARNVAAQLTTFGVRRAGLGGSPVYIGDGQVRRDTASAVPDLRRPASIVQYAVFVAALGALLFVLARRRAALSVRERRALWLTGAGLLANAAICGVLSVPAERYQSRVAWVLPLVVFAIAWPKLKARPQPSQAAESRDRSAPNVSLSAGDNASSSRAS